MATPNDMPATNPFAGTDVSETAQGLYVDPTPGFQPTLDLIGQQRVQANERYAKNKADIANLFGTLTQVNIESQNRVNQQFQKSIADQQMATAQRVAEARSGAAQTQQSALAAASERGGGPMGNLAASPVAVAAERGIANQNALQAIFEGQQGAIQQQTLQDLLAAQRGYGYQQVAAGQQLNRNLEDVLMGLSGQEADVRGQLAQAQLGARGQVLQANYNEIMGARAAEAQAEADRLDREAAQARAILESQTSTTNAKLAAEARLKAAEIAAKVSRENSIRAANAKAGSGGAKKYSAGATGIFERIADQAGPKSATAFSKSIADIISGAGVRKPPASLSEAMQRWIRSNPDMAPYYQGYAADVLSEILSKSIPSGGSSNFVQSTPGSRSSLDQLFSGFGTR